MFSFQCDTLQNLGVTIGGAAKFLSSSIEVFGNPQIQSQLMKMEPFMALFVEKGWLTHETIFDIHTFPFRLVAFATSGTICSADRKLLKVVSVLVGHFTLILIVCIYS